MVRICTFANSTETAKLVEHFQKDSTAKRAKYVVGKSLWQEKPDLAKGEKWQASMLHMSPHHSNEFVYYAPLNPNPDDPEVFCICTQHNNDITNIHKAMGSNPLMNSIKMNDGTYSKPAFKLADAPPILADAPPITLWEALSNTLNNIVNYFPVFSYFKH